MTDAISDDMLLQRAVVGDGDALETLLLAHFDRLVAHVSQRLPDDVRNVLSADDVVQDAFIVVFQRIRDFEPRAGGGFSTWLSRIAENSLMDAVKALRAAKRGGGRTALADEIAPDQSDVIPLLDLLTAHSWTASRSAARRETVAALQLALDQLMPDYRDALRWRYIEMQPVAAIAARLRRSEGAVHMLLSRALEALRLRLEKTAQTFSSNGGL